MICIKLMYILLYNSFTGHLYLYAPLLYIVYLLMTKSLTFTLLLLNELLFLFSILKYFLIICLNLQFARVASLLTQCAIIIVLATSNYAVELSIGFLPADEVTIFYI